MPDHKTSQLITAEDSFADMKPLKIVAVIHMSVVLYVCVCVWKLQSVCMLGHYAHSVRMTNNYHMNNDNFLLANSHKKNVMMKRAYQLSAQTGQW